MSKGTAFENAVEADMEVARAAFAVPGTPQPWRRARSAGARRFKDPASEAHADLIRWAWRDVGSPTVGAAPFRLTVIAQFQRPASHLTTRGVINAAGRAAEHPSRSDVDNIAKAVMDALNGLAWDDDRQCVFLAAEKRWLRRAGARSYTLVEFHEAP